MQQREIEFSFKRTFISPLLPFVIPLLSGKLAQITRQNIQKNQSQAHCFLYQLSHPNKEKEKEKMVGGDPYELRTKLTLHLG